MPQTKTDIKNILAEAGLWANRRLGQHFLIDGNLMNKLVEAADIGPADVLLEVGAGTGNLTELLLQRAGWVVAIEIDRGLFGQVAKHLAAHNNLSLVNTDVLRRKTEIAPVVLMALQEALQRVGAEHPAVRLLMVSNLPYNVASPLLINLLACDLSFARFCFTVQAEVAQRIMGDHGSKNYGPMSIALQSTCDLERLFALPPQVFWPAPAVESTALRLDVNMQNFGDAREFKSFLNLLHLAFAHRRKTLHYNLEKRYDAEVVRAACRCLDIDPRWRAEQIAVIGWLELFRELPPLQEHVPAR